MDSPHLTYLVILLTHWTKAKNLLVEKFQKISFPSLRNYCTVTYEEALKKVKFFNYENFGNINEAYSNFIQKLTSVIDKIAPCKTKRVKGNSKEWFDSVVSERINNRDKLFKKLRNLDYILTRKTIRKPATKLRN